jgi:hypothetical protein
MKDDMWKIVDSSEGRYLQDAKYDVALVFPSKELAQAFIDCNLSNKTWYRPEFEINSTNLEKMEITE